MKKLLFASLVSCFSFASPSQLDVLDILKGDTGAVSERVSTYDNLESNVVFSGSDFKDLILKNSSIDSEKKAQVAEYFYAKYKKGLQAYAYMGENIELNLIELACFVDQSNSVLNSFYYRGQEIGFQLDKYMSEQTLCLAGSLSNNNLSVFQNMVTREIGPHTEYPIDKIVNLFKKQEDLDLAAHYACYHPYSGQYHRLCKGMINKGANPFRIIDNLISFRGSVIHMLDSDMFRDLSSNYSEDFFSKTFILHKDISIEVNGSIAMMVLYQGDFVTIDTMFESVELDFEKQFLRTKNSTNPNSVVDVYQSPLDIIRGNESLSESQQDKLLWKINDKLEEKGYEFDSRLFEELESSKPDYAWVKLYLKNKDTSKIAFQEYAAPFSVYMKVKGFESIDQMAGTISQSNDDFDDLMDF